MLKAFLFSAIFCSVFVGCENLSSSSKQNDATENSRNPTKQKPSTKISQQEFEKLADETDVLLPFTNSPTLELLYPAAQIARPAQKGFNPAHDSNWWQGVYHDRGNKFSNDEAKIPFLEGFVFSITGQKANNQIKTYANTNPVTAHELLAIQPVLKQHAKNIKPFIDSLEKEEKTILVLGKMYQQLKIEEEKNNPKSSGDTLDSFLDYLQWYLTYLINISYDQFQKNNSAKIQSGDPDSIKFIRQENQRLVKIGTKILTYFDNPVPY